MSRYLRVSLLIGVGAALLALVLTLTGVVRGLELVWQRIALGPSESGELGAASLGEFLRLILPAVAAFAVAWITVDSTRHLHKIGLAVGMLLFFGAFSYTLGLFGVPYNPVGTWLAVIFSLGGGLVYAGTEGGSRKRLLRANLEGRVSQETFSALMDAPAPPNFAGQNLVGTVVACVILGPRGEPERLEARQVVALAQRILRETVLTLAEAGAYIETVDGEMVRAVFGNLQQRPDHAARACQTALELRERLERISHEMEDRQRYGFDFGIGVESGELACAATGSHGLGGYGIVGPALVRARRLAGLNQTFHTRILLGGGALDRAAGQAAVRPVELLRFLPDDAPEEIYELAGLTPGQNAEAAARLEEFWKGVILYREGALEEARAIFQSQQGRHYDGLLEYYLARTDPAWQEEEALRLGVEIT